MEPLRIQGSFSFVPHVHGDQRGSFHEWLRADELRKHTGHSLSLAQANCLISTRGALRGLHFADVPPGQARYITCIRGAVLDVVVDLRVGSPSFGQWAAVRLDDETHRCVYVAEGLGHGFMSLTDGATVVYLCSQPYRPARERAVHPLDPELGIRWPEGIKPILSAKDAAAPSLADAQKSGLLPGYAECLEHYAELRLSD